MTSHSNSGPTGADIRDFTHPDMVENVIENGAGHQIKTLKSEAA